MGVLGTLVRVTFDDWLGIDEADDNTPLIDAWIGTDRSVDLDKSWDALDVLIALAGASLTGGTLATDPYRGAEVRALDTSGVRAVAEALADLSFEQLIAAHDPDALAGAYPPGVWTDPAALAVLRGPYERTRAFFAAAHADLDFVLIIIG